MAATKVLYIHGMETGPRGDMYHALNKTFQVHAPDMKVSMLKLQRNSLFRNLLKTSPCIRAFFLIIIGYLVSIKFKSDGSFIEYASIGFGCIYLFCNRARILSIAVTLSLNSSLEIQQSAIKEYDPDIIIGASWGGFVTLELIKRGDWNGKTILFAPAYRKLTNYMHRLPVNHTGEHNLIPTHIEMTQNILVVQSDSDQLIDCKDSELLSHLNRHCMDLQMIKGDDHTFKESCKNGTLADIVVKYLTEQKF